jgi:hypothetical protein
MASASASAGAAGSIVCVNPPPLAAYVGYPAVIMHSAIVGAHSSGARGRTIATSGRGIRLSSPENSQFASAISP